MTSAIDKLLGVIYSNINEISILEATLKKAAGELYDDRAKLSGLVSLTDRDAFIEWKVKKWKLMCSY